MATADTYPHVILGADGEALIESTRYTVQYIAVEQYFYGCSAEEILRQHPDLRPAEVYSALAYFHDHHDTFWVPSKGPKPTRRGWSEYRGVGGTYSISGDSEYPRSALAMLGNLSAGADGCYGQDPRSCFLPPRRARRACP